ncbi:hypothetical protein [Okeania sp. KiyG1]|uniref:hypothetical protein n=1 Tax=Okeania sp. KiyG1 TaxID=2720165 RepID=UPI001920893F|nr:hypothetical protein [Okeania sp. KiyG1]GGA52794.1 hypothetical protein CYANOKiyG1_72710 [Okeania sp. KiyG1]
MNNLKSEAQFAVCIKNKDYPASLELHKIYVALTDEEATKDGDLRIVDESGEDYLALLMLGMMQAPLAPQFWGE